MLSCSRSFTRSHIRCFQTESLKFQLCNAGCSHSAPSLPLCCSQISSSFVVVLFFFPPCVFQGFQVLAEAATSSSWEEPPEDSAGMKAWEGVWLGAGALQMDTRSVSGLGFFAAHPTDAHIAVGPSEISSSLCSIISLRMEYLENKGKRDFSASKKTLQSCKPHTGDAGLHK